MRPWIVPASFPSVRSGWLTGTLLGIVLGLSVFPPVRYTLGAQLQLTLVQDTLPYLRALDVRRGAGEVPRLNRVAASAREDYLLQVGRATALAHVAEPGRSIPTSPVPVSSERDLTLVRLGMIARDFPVAPGAYAHLIRYMMRDRVRIIRSELRAPAPRRSGGGDAAAALRETDEEGPARSIPARRRDVRLIEWAVRSGQRLDRDNAFWPTMLAITYFAALRDAEALQALEQAARKPRWDAYLYEEILGQWRLYAAAYGDYGAAQKIGPLSMLAFPHLRELRYMAEMARWHADRAADAGQFGRAIRIRRHLGWLGRCLRDTAHWSYEALYGTDLFFLASTDRGARFAPSAIRHLQQWQRAATGYLGLLERQRRQQERQWLYQEAQLCCELRDRIDVARVDAAYPGIPPGIPLLALFRYWMLGYCLLQQALAFGLCAVLLSLLVRWRVPDRHVRLWRIAVGVTVPGCLSGALFLLFGAVPTARAALLLLAAACALCVLVAHWLASSHARAELHWSPGATGRMLALLLIPALAALHAMQNYLTSLHPVATLLASLTGAVPDRRPQDALLIALLTAGLPFLAILVLTLRALYRRVSPAQSVVIGVRSLALPMVTCLLLVYLLVLHQTLRYDAAASVAINMAARNDLQWVLIHSAPPDA
ncbi:MAG: hypothetical protein RMJ43_13390 [Chloroherpetonaceae bacterium]|nr:hypothetical protein [Chthonomonadaceae bacterium]MDW8208822.1 hypothetical protein [Chloroherpetonaceae bacterium]